jgi:mono/diheme cytochrome c family protein
MRFVSILAGIVVPMAAQAQGTVSAERGLQVSIFGGCHDCHTEGYLESEGQIDPGKALKGTAIGWRGPWGTTYPANLRLTAEPLGEDDFVARMKELKTKPPMPWFGVRALDESDLRSLYQYIRSLGDPGEPVPAALGPGEEPQTPYIPIAPPVMPQG